MNSNKIIEKVTMPLPVTFNEEHQRILIALHHLGQIPVNKLRIASYLLSSSEHDYVKLLKQIIYQGAWAYGTVDPIEVFFEFGEFFDSFEKFKKLSDFKKIYDVRKLSAVNFNKLPEIDEELQYLSGRALIRKSKSSSRIITYDGKTKKIIQLMQKNDGSSYGRTYDDPKKFDSIKTKESPCELISLTDEGKEVAKRLIEERRVIFRSLRSKRTTIFVACAFGHNEIDALYEKSLKPSCEKVGYNALRVDLNEPGQTITQFMLEGIENSECVIADLTFARPSVYFEVGYADGLGIKNLILTCRKDHFRGTEDNKKVHFDLEQYKISYWSKTDQGEFEWEERMSPAERLELVLKGAK